MPLYTTILDYAGGTHVAQVRAANASDALGDWIGRLVSDNVAGESSAEVADAFGTASEANLVALDGLSDVWCATASTAKGLALVNIVTTAE